MKALLQDGRQAHMPAPPEKRLLINHLGEPLEPPPVSPARGPPVVWDDLVQAEDDHSLHQASAEDVPMIDIHRR